MKRPEDTPVSQSQYAAAIDDLVDSYPLVAEWMAATAYDGEEAGTRQPCTYTVSLSDGMWKLCLRDRNRGKCLWVSARTHSELLAVLEDHLSGSGCVWRDDRYAGHETAKRNNQPKRS